MTDNATSNTIGWAQSSASRGPLEGVRVLDLSSVIMGPWATQILADLGADVISVEAIGGDAVRFLGLGHHPLLCGIALNVLRNKRNISLDLKNPSGREAFLKVAATCDVVFTNLRPGPRQRLGLTYEEIRKVRPDIIFCHAQGWPSDSDRADDPAYDDVIQSGSGMAALFTMQNGKPSIAPIAMADQVCSLTIVYSILAALLHRQRTGVGQSVEIPMQQTMASFVLVMHGQNAVLEPPLGPPGYERISSPLRAPMPTKDSFLQIVLYTRQNWIDFLTDGGIEDAASDPRLDTPVARNRHYADLYTTMGKILKTRCNSEWISWCKAHGVAYSPVVSLEELLQGLPVVQHSVGGQYRQLPIPVNFSRTPGSVRTEAPLPGANNVDVLTEAGYSPHHIDELYKSGGLVDSTASKPK
jgi:crotonobetainyl-CoA:carnitine CoA-transferase CaiB-like acyl-CoA transferase